MNEITKPHCDGCNTTSELVGGETIYPHRVDLYARFFYRCPNCGSYVGCHPGTKRPLGNLAGPELRAVRLRAHNAFDRKWKTGEWGTRHEAYARLADFLGVPVTECHIGMFTVEQCYETIKISKRDLGSINRA